MADDSESLSGNSPITTTVSARNRPREIIFPRGFWCRVSKQAVAEGCSRSEVVRRATRRYLRSPEAVGRMQEHEEVARTETERQASAQFED
jgi:hypothetical protein